jgi:hypothetical protein
MLSEYHYSTFGEHKFTSVDAALSCNVQHKIHKLPDSTPPCCIIYCLLGPMLDELKQQLKTLLEVGLICPSMSPYGDWQ